MHVQVVNFRLKDLTDEEFVAGCERDAPAFAAVPGLVSKVWLRDPATGTYGGVKIWESREAMEAYLKSALWNALATNPHFVDATSRDFEVIDAPTRITRGYVHPVGV